MSGLVIAVVVLCLFFDHFQVEIERAPGCGLLSATLNVVPRVLHLLFLSIFQHKHLELNFDVIFG